MNANYEKSKQLAKAVSAEKKACFLNATIGLFALNDPLASYCEGYAVIPKLGFPIEHAWIVQGGEVIDPTWVDEEMADYVYVASYSITAAELDALMGEGDPDFPLVLSTAEDRGRAATVHHKHTYELAMSIHNGKKGK